MSSFDYLTMFKDTDDMNTSKHILEYQFWLEFPKPSDFNTENNWIDVISRNILYYHEHSQLTIPDNLFGKHPRSGEIRFYNYKDCTERIIRHSVISALHTLEYLISKQPNQGKNYASPRTAANHLHFNDINTKYLSYTNSDGMSGPFAIRCPNPFTIHCLNKDEDDSKSTFEIFRNSYSTKTTKTFVNDLPKSIICKLANVKCEYKNHKYGRGKDIRKLNYYSIPLYNLHFYHHILENNTFFEKALKYNEETSTRSVKQFNKLIEQYYICGIPKRICTSSPNISNELKSCIDVDAILLQYKCERFFHTYMVHQLNEYTKTHKNVSPERMLQFSIIPDAYSIREIIFEAFRNYGQAYITDNYRTNPERTINIEEKRNESNFNALLQSSDISPEIYNILSDYQAAHDLNKKPARGSALSYETAWSDCIEHAINYLSYVYYPVYEKYFFLCTYEYCKKDTELATFESMRKLLFSYVQEHISDYSLPKFKLKNDNSSHTVSKTKENNSPETIEGCENKEDNSPETIECPNNKEKFDDEMRFLYKMVGGIVSCMKSLYFEKYYQRTFTKEYFTQLYYIPNKSKFISNIEDMHINNNLQENMQRTINLTINNMVSSISQTDIDELSAAITNNLLELILPKHGICLTDTDDTATFHQVQSIMYNTIKNTLLNTSFF